MTRERWQGLRAIAEDAVEHGSRAIERVQRETARRPFEVLEAIPPLAAPARAIHAVHDASVSGAHLVIRLANRLIALALELALRRP